MSEIKKDHSIGAGTGAVAGAVAGAAIGSAAGPLGTAAGAVVGGVVGARAGDSIAEWVNPTEYRAHFEREYKRAPYYVSGSRWEDYEPAYRYGYDTYPHYRGRRLDEVERDLEHGWDRARGESRLAWPEAREAVRDSWHHIERAMPGDADRDGR